MGRTCGRARRQRRRLRLLALAAVLPWLGMAWSRPVLACSTCGCSLNSDWASQGYNFGAGFNLTLRFDYFDQDQLRTGLGRVDTGTIQYPNAREIQKQTINRMATFDLGYSPNDRWSVDVLIPAVDRTHSTVAPGDVPPSYSQSSGLGDVRLLARYKGLSKDRSWGLLFGVKLPTGRYDDVFSSGPQAGQPLDRGLQLGTGTTDLLAGAFKFGSLDRDWGYFAQALADVSLNSKEGFRPGDALTVSGGFRYTAAGAFVPQVQLNWRAEKPETGVNADTENSGATLAYLSPGFTLELAHACQMFVFVQVPVYQRVTGYQLEPGYLVSAGLHWSF